MSPELKNFFLRWLITTASVLVAAGIVPGIHWDQWGTLFMASLLLGILNTLVRPLLVLAALPLVVATLGFFMLVINALLLYFVGVLLGEHFIVEDFTAAFLGALVISIVSLWLNLLFGAQVQTGTTRFERRAPTSGSSGSRSRSGRSSDEDDDGPVIDV